MSIDPIKEPDANCNADFIALRNKDQLFTAALAVKCNQFLALITVFVVFCGSE